VAIKNMMEERYCGRTLLVISRKQKEKMRDRDRERERERTRSRIMYTL
jgi:hypothetical protein